MLRSTLIALATLSLSLTHLSSASAQSRSQVLCYEAKSKRITVVATCPKGTTQLSGSNLATQIGITTSTPPATAGALDLSKITCTTTSGSASGGTSNGEVGVAAQCKKGIMLARSFSVNDSFNSKPSLQSETILKDKNGAPVGTQIVLTSQGRSLFSVTLKIDCCQ